jgi:predicted anti-sigma-YlaC factor YlaD
VNQVADFLGESSGDLFTSEEDPELVREALPFALKTMEGLLAQSPDNKGLLLSTCQGFMLYSYAFVAQEADELEYEDYQRSEEMKERALKLYLRAKGYCLRGLEVDHPGLGPGLLTDPAEAAGRLSSNDVDLAYWTSAAWGAAISAGKDRPELLADLGTVKALLSRLLELDPDYDQGSVHEAWITLESLPATAGGSPARAREHFDKAVALSGGLKASPYVTFAEGVAVQSQDRKLFQELLDKALAIDPDKAPEDRLVNLVAQKRARLLQERVDDLFLDLGEPKEEIP